MATAALQPVESGPPKPSLFEILEKLTKVAAIATAFIYFCGYVIVSSYQGVFGVAEYSFLKPRIFSAGLLLFLFASVPALLAFRIFNIFGLSRSTGFSIDYKPENKVYACLLFCFSFFVAARYIAMLFVQFLGRGVGAWIDRGWIDHAYDITAILFFFIAAFAVKRKFNVQPGRCALLDALVALGFGIRDFFARDNLLVFKIELWCYAAGLLAVYFVAGLKESDFRRKIEWEIVAILFVGGALYWFSLNIYANVKPEYGGGQPLRVAVEVDEKLGAVNGKLIVGDLIDQTDDGFYAVPATLGARCVFVPKSRVVSVRFFPASR